MGLVLGPLRGIQLAEQSPCKVSLPPHTGDLAIVSTLSTFCNTKAERGLGDFMTFPREQQEAQGLVPALQIGALPVALTGSSASVTW